MKKAFEKILERLERDIAGKPTPEEYNNGINRAYSIVQEVAEEYSRCDTNIPCYECDAYDKEKHFCPKYCKVIKATTKELKDFYSSWIPCNVRLPEENIEVDVTIKEIDGSTYTKTSWLQEGQWVVKKNPLEPKVIAWKERPEPYYPEGD